MQNQAGTEGKKSRVRSEKEKNSDKRYREANKEKIKIRAHKYYLANRERVLEKSKKWNSENKERFKNTQTLWVEANRDRLREYQREWVRKNSDRINAKRREQRKQNPEASREYHREWEKRNHKKVRAQCRIRERAERAANPELARKKDRERYRTMKPEERIRRERYRREWYEKNRDKVIKLVATWRKENRDKCLEIGRKASRKAKSTIRGKLNHRMQQSLLSMFGKKKAHRSWQTLVGYSIDDLMKHIEKNFLPGMSWENRDQWHIDHIIPISVFNYSCPEDIDFKRCWALSNLRPLWAADNIRKSNKLEKPFQPSLAIGGYYER